MDTDPDQHVTAYRKKQTYRKPARYAGTKMGVAPPGYRALHAGGWARPSSIGLALLRAGWEPMTEHAVADVARYADRSGHGAQAMACPMQQMATVDLPLVSAWSTQQPRAQALTAPFTPMEAGEAIASAHWTDIASHHAGGNSAPFGSPAVHNVGRFLTWRQRLAASIARSPAWRSLVERGAYVALPWGPAGARSSSIRIDWPHEPLPTTDPIVVPNLPVYVMIPTLSCVRLPDRVPIRLLAISMQAELGSWAWTFTAPVAHADTALLNAPGGEPTQIEVRVNGYVWTFVVDGYDDNRRFGSNTVTLRGKSRSALLAEPYATVRSYIETEDRNASQLADQELPIDWTLVWDAPDWLVPGGTFSYQDLAPVDAIAQVANAIGAALFSDPATKQLSVQPSYPVSPWEWDTATPYAILPAAITTSSDSSWQGGTNANGIYVYSRDSASGAFVKLAGSDGATQLPMIVDTLTITTDAQRERGRNALAAAGMKRVVNRTIPLFPTPPPAGQPDLGPVPPGKLLEVEDATAGGGTETWRGQVVAVRIDAQRGGQALSVRQHLTIERHFR